MFPSRLELKEYRPGNLLRLRSTDFKVNFLYRVLATIFYLPLLGGLLFFGALLLTRDWEAPFYFPAFLAMILAFFAIGVLVLGVSLYVLGSFFGGWSLIDLDRSNGELTATFDGHWLWSWSRTTIPLDRVNEITAQFTGRNDDEFTIQLHLIHEEGSGNSKQSTFKFKVAKVDLQREAQAICFAIANMVSLNSYKITRSDHLLTEILLVPDEPDEDREAIPTISSNLDFESSEDSKEQQISGVPDEVRETEIELEPFDPDEYREDYTEASNLQFEWDPGRVVRITEPPMGVANILGASCVGGLVTGFIAAVIVVNIMPLLHHVTSWSIPPPLFNPWVMAPIVGLIGFFGTAVKRTIQNKKTETVFHWDKNIFAIRDGDEDLEVSLNQLENIAVRGYRHHSDAREHIFYHAEVMVDLGDGTRVIMETSKKRTKDQVYQIAGSFADELTNHLHVDWDWKGFERTGTTISFS